MKQPRSLRSRVVLGSLLWTAGLLAIAHMLSLALMHRVPLVLRVGHQWLFGLGLILMLAGLSGLRSGLSPFDQLRARLTAVREGRERRVEGLYPVEVQPLVSDLNTLLEHRERIVQRALATAGDLAHGLKTPLAVLTLEAERAGAAGHPEIAAGIQSQVDRMRRQTDYHLARARAAASGAAAGARCTVADSAAGLARTLHRLYAGKGLEIAVEAAADHCVRCRREDLDEMLGNLLDNACKWGRTRITMHSERCAEAIVINVDDDGPGIPEALREAVLRRGVRADEAAPGSGFGLAIVRDLAELYGGSITLSTSPAGGLRAALRLLSC